MYINYGLIYKLIEVLKHVMIYIDYCIFNLVTWGNLMFHLGTTGPTQYKAMANARIATGCTGTSKNDERFNGRN